MDFFLIIIALQTTVISTATFTVIPVVDTNFHVRRQDLDARFSGRPFRLDRITYASAFKRDFTLPSGSFTSDSQCRIAESTTKVMIRGGF